MVIIIIVIYTYNLLSPTVAVEGLEEEEGVVGLRVRLSSSSSMLVELSVIKMRNFKK